MSATFSRGRNIAMKVPPHQHEATLRFYRDVLVLRQVESLLPEGFEGFWISSQAAIVHLVRRRTAS